MKNLAPDYSKYTHTFSSYCYAGPNDGHWHRDGVPFYTGKDLRTVEGYKEYKDAGMDIYFPQTDARITTFYEGNVKTSEWAEDFLDKRFAEWEQVKIYWDRAYEAGLKKIIMMEGQIQNWSGVEHGMLLKPVDVVIADGEVSPYTFQNEEEFDEAIAKILQPYVNHPGFYGVMLKDEPCYSCVEAYGQTCRAVKRVGKKVFNRDIFVQHNLIPMRASINSGVYSMMPLLDWFTEKGAAITPRDYYIMIGGGQPNQEVINPKEKVRQALEEELAAYGGNEVDVASMKYEKYLEQFVLAMGSDYVQYDDYPLKQTDEKVHTLGCYLRTIQVVANVARKLDIDFQMVSQSFSSEPKGGSALRTLTEDECRWLNNILLAFGVSQINYYTYIAKKSNSAYDLYYKNEGSFITREGEKTDIYYAYQKINQENNKFAPTKLNFKYQGSRIYNVQPLRFQTECCWDKWLDNTYAFKELKDICVNKESALITESYDKENERYMYCVQNMVLPIHKGVETNQTTVLTFDAAKYKYTAIYRNGERTLCELQDGKLTIQNEAGQAAFVIPY